MKTISLEELERALYELDGYCQISEEIVGNRKGEAQWRLVYEDPNNRLWIVHYLHHHEYGIQDKEFTAHEAEEYEECVTKYRKKI